MLSVRYNWHVNLFNLLKHRATAYGIWSLFVPAGYNRDPTAHFGYKKVAMILEHSYTVNEEELITEKDIARSRGKNMTK